MLAEDRELFDEILEKTHIPELEVERYLPQKKQKKLQIV